MNSFDYDASLSRYFRREISDYLSSKGIETLDDLLDLIYGNESRWWLAIGLQTNRAYGIIRWLYEHQDMMDDVPNSVKRKGPTLVGIKDVNEVEDVSTTNFSDIVNPVGNNKNSSDIVLDGDLPLTSRVFVPQKFDGSSGKNRNLTSTCNLSADNDLIAIEAWLKARASNPNTNSAYKKEAERFLIWSIVEKQMPMSSLGIEECSDYPRWLEMLGRVDDSTWNTQWREPQSTWLGPKNVGRSSPEWRPFNGPLSHSSRRTALTVVRQLFSFLHKTGYLLMNPFDQISSKVPLLPGEGKPQEFADRSLSPSQWEEILNYLDNLPDGLIKSRLKVILTLGKGLGMRSAEILNAKCGWIEKRLVNGEEVMMISVVGKGDKERRLPVSEDKLKIINEYLRMRNELPIGTVPGSDVPLLASLRRHKDTGYELTRAGLNYIVSEFFENVAASIQTERPFDAAKLRASSTHWLRHTFAVTSLKRMPVNVVQSAMGHASVGTTTRYLRPDESEIIKAMKEDDSL